LIVGWLVVINFFLERGDKMLNIFNWILLNTKYSLIFVLLFLTSASISASTDAPGFDGPPCQKINQERGMLGKNILLLECYENAMVICEDNIDYHIGNYHIGNKYLICLNGTWDLYGVGGDDVHFSHCVTGEWKQVGGKIWRC